MERTTTSLCFIVFLNSFLASNTPSPSALVHTKSDPQSTPYSVGDNKGPHGVIWLMIGTDPPLNNFSFTLAHTGTRSDMAESGSNKTTFIVSIVMTSVACFLGPIFIPVNVRAASSFINISRNKQPMFLLFGTVNVICVADLLVGIVEGVSFWFVVPESGCQILGGCQVITFFSLSSTLSTVCIFRITAVVKPSLYKKLAKQRLLVKVIAGIFTFSLVLSAMLILSNTLNFRYVGPPYSTGCSLFMVQDWFHIYGSLLNMTIIFINLLLINTYYILHRFFGATISTSEHVRAMRKGALFVTSLSTVCYFLCHLPTIITYTVLGIDNTLVLKLESPYRLILDFVLLWCPHLYSCVLPLCLVTGSTLERVGAAAKVTSQSRMRSLQRPRPNTEQ